MYQFHTVKFTQPVWILYFELVTWLLCSGSVRADASDLHLRNQHDRREGSKALRKPDLQEAGQKRGVLNKHKHKHTTNTFSHKAMFSCRWITSAQSTLRATSAQSTGRWEEWLYCVTSNNCFFSCTCVNLLHILINISHYNATTQSYINIYLHTQRL